MSNRFSPFRVSSRHFGGVGRALSSPHYRRYASGHIANVHGWWCNRLGIGWLTWELTGSAGWLGIVAFVGMIPVTLIAPFAGAMADRFGHRQVAISAGSVGGIVTLTLGTMTLAGYTTVPLLLALSVLQGLSFGIEFPARQALIPQLVKRENVSAALAFNATTFQVGAFVGPVIAGVLITAYGPGASILMFAFSNFWMATMVYLIRYRPAEQAARSSDGFLAEIRAGFRYIATTPALRILFVVSLASGLLLRPFNELLPGFAADVFARGPEGLAMLNAAAGLGALACGVFLAFRGRTQGLVRIMVTGGLLGALGLALFAVMPKFEIALPILTVAAMLMLACHVGAYSLVQNSTDPAMRGRVISIAVAISVGGPATGALAVGWLAEAVGLQPALALSGVAAFAAILCVLPGLRRRTAEIEDDSEQ